MNPVFRIFGNFFFSLSYFPRKFVTRLSRTRAMFAREYSIFGFTYEYSERTKSRSRIDTSIRSEESKERKRKRKR